MQISTYDKSIKKFDFANRSFWLFLAKVIPTITFLSITILYSRELSLTNYGVYQSVWMYINVLVVVLNFGAYQILLSTNYKSIVAFLKSNKKKVIALYFVIIPCIALFFISSSKNLSFTIQLIVVASIALQVATVFCEAILINSKKEIYVFLINLFYSICFFAWHFYLLKTGFDLQFLLKGVFFIGIVRLSLFWLLIRPDHHVKKTVPIPINHWLFIGMNDIVNILTKWMDKLILIYFLHPSEFAIFFNGSIEIPLFGILVSVIGSLLLVDISSSLAWKSKVIEMFNNTFLLTSHFVFPMFWFLTIYKNEIFQILFDGKYNESIEIFMLTLLIVPLRITNYSAILQCYNKAALILKGSILDIIVALLLMPLFYFILGLKGVALAIVVSTYLQSYYYLYHSSKILSTDIYKLIPVITLVKRFIISFLLLVILYFSISDLPIINRLIIATLFTTSFIFFNIAIAYYPEFKKASKLKI